MDDTSEIISRLKFISKIQKGEKINTRSTNPTIQQEGLVTTISRTVFVDSRENTLSFLSSTIKRCFELLSLYSRGDTLFDRTLTVNLHEDLHSCLAGLENIKNTYDSDVMFCCKIDTLIQDIEARLSEFGEIVLKN